MGKKQTKKTAASDNLIDSLMDDLKDLNLESSYHDSDDESFVHKEDENAMTMHGSPLWDSLEQGLESSEFSGGAENNFSFGDNVEMPAGLDVQRTTVQSSEPVDDGFSPEYHALKVKDDEKYDGPSADAGYESIDNLMNIPPGTLSKLMSSNSDKTKSIVEELTRPVGIGEDKTVSIQHEMGTLSNVSDGDKTIAVEGFAQAKASKKRPPVDVQVSVGDFRGAGKSVLTSVDASLAQAENLKIAQRRILDLEREIENLRTENEELSSAGEVIRIRTDELEAKVLHLEKEKHEDKESSHSEVLLLKGSLQHRETELAKSKIKIEELESRLKSDFKKIRVRERELENRLELLRAEKAALTRSKDEYILEQKRKIDQLSQELDNYRKKCLELNKALVANQDQFKRTERALRLALTNLEVSDDGVVPLKKAE